MNDAADNAAPERQGFSGSNLARVGDHNYRVTLQAIRVHGTITRTKLTGLTGLTGPSIANITNRLLRDGLIVTAGTVQGGRGQPPSVFAINPDGCYSLGLNIDRDHLCAVLLDHAGNVRARRSTEAAFALPHQAATFFRSAVKSMRATKSIDTTRILGVGVAIPDRLSEIVSPRKPQAYHAWEKADLTELFGGAVKGPIFVENDAKAAALGELQFGHGLTQPNFFYLLVTAGLGGAMVIEGNLWRGAHSHSGEWVLPLAPGAAGNLGEAVSLQGLFGTLSANGVSVADISSLATLSKKGRKAMEDWLDRAAALLLPPLLTLGCVVDPQAIFLGGRLPDDLAEALVIRLNTALLNEGRGTLSLATVRRSALGADAPVIGAALLPLYDRLYPSRTALMKSTEA